MRTWRVGKCFDQACRPPADGLEHSAPCWQQVSQPVRAERFVERAAQPGIRRLDQDGANVNAAVGDNPAVVTDQLAMVEAVHHLRGDVLHLVVAALPLGLSPQPQGRQHLDPRPVAADRAQQPHEAVVQLGVVLVVPGAGHGEDWQEAMGQELPHAAEGAVESPLAADGVVVRRGEAVDGYTELQAVRRRVLCLPQAPQPVLLEDGAVGQHRRRAVAERPFQDGGHVRVEERLATGEVILLDAEGDRLVEGAADVFEAEEAKAAVVRRAADEAVAAGEVAEGAGDLKPEVVEMAQGDFWCGRSPPTFFQDRQLDTHRWTPPRPALLLRPLPSSQEAEGSSYIISSSKMPG